MIRHVTLASIALALAGVACAGNASNVRDNELQAVENRADAQADMIDRQHEYHADNAEQKAELQNENVALMEERTTFASEAQSRLEKVAVRLDEAREKAKIGPDPSQVFNQELQAVEDAHGELSVEVEQIEAIADEDWAQAKAEIDDKLSALEDRTSRLIEVAENA